MYSQIEQLHQALELIFMKLLDFVVVHFPEESIIAAQTEISSWGSDIFKSAFLR